MNYLTLSSSEALSVEPLPLSLNEKKLIKEYLSTFVSFIDVGLQQHELGDASKLTDILGYIRRLKDHMKDLYADIPQIVKDENLVPRPEYPHW
jgi:hypothetical protein